MELRNLILKTLFMLFPSFIYFVWVWPLVMSHSNAIYSQYWGDNIFSLIYEFGGQIDYLQVIFNLVFNTLFDNIFVFNLSILLAFIFTFYSSYFVLRKLVNNIYISLLGAIVITVAPIRIWYSFEWFSHAFWTFLLLYVYFLLRFMRAEIPSQSGNEKGNIGNDEGKVVNCKERDWDDRNKVWNDVLKDVVLAGVFYGLAFFTHPYQGVMIFFITIPFFVWSLIYIKKNTYKVVVEKWVVFGVIAVVLSLPTLYSLFTTSIGVEGSIIERAERSPEDRWAYSARPWHYVIPDINHPVFGNAAVKIHYAIWDQQPYYLTEPFFPKEHTLFLGYTLIGLSTYAVFAYLIKPYFLKGNLNYQISNFELRRFYVKFFLILGVSAFVFSMPPFVDIKGFRLYFPSEFIYEFLPQFRAFARFGVFVFIANTVIAMIGLEHLIRHLRLGRVGAGFLLTAVSMLVVFEFVNFPPFHSISTKPTPPYLWLARQEGDFSYMEIPARTDYTDRLYQSVHGKEILNPYLRTSENVREIKDTLWNENFAQPEELWCVGFRELGGRYIMYHEKELNKQKVVNEFVKTGVVTQELKVAMAESWGYPVWGNHVPKTEEDLFKAEREREMKNLLMSDPKFSLVKEFSNEEIVASRSNKNFSADKFDAVAIFEINEEYCSR